MQRFIALLSLFQAYKIKEKNCINGKTVCVRSGSQNLDSIYSHVQTRY